MSRAQVCVSHTLHAPMHTSTPLQPVFVTKINDYNILTYADAHADTEIVQHQIDHTCFALSVR